MYRILAINPGSTSTKIAVYDDETCVFSKSIRHKEEELAPFNAIADQFEFRLTHVLDTLKEEAIELNSFHAIVGRGGLIRPLQSGVYEVNEAMLHDLKEVKYAEHACNLGALIAHGIASKLGISSYIVDPVVVDELAPVARISGLPQMPRVSAFHALNQKAIAKRYAAEVGKPYTSLNLVVAHLGGGISVAAHQQGRVIDVNQALDGWGAFSPERSGTLPSGALVKLCFSGEYTEQEIKKLLVGRGGVYAHLGTTDMQTVKSRIEGGDTHAAQVVEAMCYTISKEIGGMIAALRGRVDAILLTGGIAYNPLVMGYLLPMVENLGVIKVYPGEDEMLALAQGTLRVLKGEEAVQLY